jgi:hypothetical protein
MPADRLLRVLTRLAREEATGARSLCTVSAEITRMTGAGIMLLVDDRPVGSVCTTDGVSARIEELQYTLGEGPCVDAHRVQHAVEEPDLARPVTMRWAAFSPVALLAGARAVFGFPVVVNGARLGALNLYRDRPGALTPDQRADALVLAGVAARAIMATQAQAPPGTLGADLAGGSDLRLVVHQAVGMVAVQLGVPVADALARLRARAFSTNRPIVALAQDVIQRRLRFEPTADDDGGG